MLWVKEGTQDRLAVIKEDADDIVLESVESSIVSDAATATFDPIAARKERIDQIARGDIFEDSNSNWMTSNQRKVEDAEIRETTAIRSFN